MHNDGMSTPIERVRSYISRDDMNKTNFDNAHIRFRCGLTPAQVAITLFRLRKSGEIRRISRGLWKRRVKK